MSFDKTLNAEGLAARISSILDEAANAGKKKAKKVGPEVGEALVEAISEGIEGAHKQVEKSMSQMMSEFNGMVRKINRNKNALKLDDIKVGLNTAEALLQSKQYASEVRKTLSGITANFNGVEVTGLNAVLKKFKSSASDLESVDWGFGRAHEDRVKRAAQAQADAAEAQVKANQKAAASQAKAAQQAKAAHEEATAAAQERAKAEQDVGDVGKTQAKILDTVTAKTQKQTDAIKKQEKATRDLANAQQTVNVKKQSAKTMADFQKLWSKASKNYSAEEFGKRYGHLMESISGDNPTMTIDAAYKELQKKDREYRKQLEAENAKRSAIGLETQTFLAAMQPLTAQINASEAISQEYAKALEEITSGSLTAAAATERLQAALNGLNKPKFDTKTRQGRLAQLEYSLQQESHPSGRPMEHFAKSQLHIFRKQIKDMYLGDTNAHRNEQVLRQDEDWLEEYIEGVSIIRKLFPSLEKECYNAERALNQALQSARNGIKALSDEAEKTQMVPNATATIEERTQATEAYIAAQNKLLDIQRRLKPGGEEQSSFRNGSVYSGKGGRLTLARRIGLDLSKFDLSNDEVDRLIESTYEQFSKVKNLLVDKQEWVDTVRSEFNIGAFGEKLNSQYPATTITDLAKQADFSDVCKKVESGLISISDAMQQVNAMVTSLALPTLQQQGEALVDTIEHQAKAMQETAASDVSIEKSKRETTSIEQQTEAINDNINARQRRLKLTKAEGGYTAIDGQYKITKGTKNDTYKWYITQRDANGSYSAWDAVDSLDEIRNNEFLIAQQEVVSQLKALNLFEMPSGQLAMFDGMTESAAKASSAIQELNDATQDVAKLPGQIDLGDLEKKFDQATKFIEAQRNKHGDAFDGMYQDMFDSLGELSYANAEAIMNEMANRIDKRLREQRQMIASNIVYHAGDLSNIGHTLKSFPLGNVPPRKSNGLGGLTGLYTTEDVDGFWGNEWSGAPISTIDISKYNLLNARANELAEAYGGFLNDLNATIYGYYEAVDETDWTLKRYTDVKSIDELYKAHQALFRNSTLSIEQFTKFIQDATAKIAGKTFADIELPAIDEGIAKSGISSALQGVTEAVFQSDSFQTQFLKMLGYEGVDLRGTKYGGTYTGGTVLFDPRQESIITTNAMWSDVMRQHGYEIDEADLEIEKKRRQLALDTAKAYSKQVDAVDQVNVKLTKADVGYHAGIISRLNKAESNGRFYGSRRDTGYYGTGHYFVDAAHKNELTLGSYRKLPYTSVDLSQYGNLFKADTDQKAGQLHRFLQDLTRYTQDNELNDVNTLFDDFKKVFGETVLSQEEFAAKLRELTNFMQHSSLDDRSDSVSTQFMKSLGYGGIDTRGTSYADTRYGIVLYDLQEASVLQANITDEIQKQGDMLEKINYAPGDVFDKNEDARIQGLLDAAAQRKAVFAEFDRLYDGAAFDKLQNDLDDVNQRLKNTDKLLALHNERVNNPDSALQELKEDDDLAPFLGDDEEELERIVEDSREYLVELEEERLSLLQQQANLQAAIDAERPKILAALEQAKLNVAASAADQAERQAKAEESIAKSAQETAKAKLTAIQRQAYNYRRPAKSVDALTKRESTLSGRLSEIESIRAEFPALEEACIAAENAVAETLGSLQKSAASADEQASAAKEILATEKQITAVGEADALPKLAESVKAAEASAESAAKAQQKLAQSTEEMAAAADKATQQVDEQTDAIREQSAVQQKPETKLTASEYQAAFGGGVLDKFLAGFNIKGQAANDIADIAADAMRGQKMMVEGAQSDDMEIASAGAQLFAESVRKASSEIMGFGTMTVGAEDALKEFYTYIANKKIRYTDKDKAEFGGKEEWKAATSSFKKTLTTSHSAPTADMLYAEILELFPGLFDPNIINETDQLISILDMFSRARAARDNNWKDVLPIPQSIEEVQGDVASVFMDMGSAMEKAMQTQARLIAGQDELTDAAEKTTSEFKAQNAELQKAADLGDDESKQQPPQDISESDLKIIAPNAAEALKQLRTAFDNKTDLIDLSGITSEQDLEAQLRSMVEKMLGDQTELALGSVSVKGDTAALELYNKELGVTIRQWYKIKEVKDQATDIAAGTDDAEPAKLAFQYDDAVYTHNIKAAKAYADAQEKAAARNEKWLNDRLANLETQERAYKYSNKSISGDAPLINDSLDIENKTIDGLAASIRERIQGAMGRELTESLKNEISRSLRILENEIKVKQYQEYTSTNMKATKFDEAKKALQYMLSALQSKAIKNNVFTEVQKDLAELRKDINDATAETGLDGLIDRKRTLEAQVRSAMAASQEDKKEEQNYKNLLNIQERLYDAKKRLAVLEVQGKKDSAAGKMASRRVDEIQEEYDAAKKLVKLWAYISEAKKRATKLDEELAQTTKEAQEKFTASEAKKSDTSKIEQHYNKIISTFKEINKLDTEIASMQSKDGGTGVFSGLIQQLEQQRGVLMSGVEAIAGDITSAFADGFVFGTNQIARPDLSVLNDFANVNVPQTLLDFFNDVNVQATLGAEKIAQFLGVLNSSSQIKLDLKSKILPQFQELIQAVQQLNELSKAGAIGETNAIYADISQRTASLAMAVQQQRSIHGEDHSQWDKDTLSYIQAETKALLKRSEALAKAAKQEQNYFRGMRKAVDGETYDTPSTPSTPPTPPTSTAPGLTTLGDDAVKTKKEQLEEWVATFGKGKAVITDFTETADGIGQIKFSVFDEATHTFRTFTAAMGDVADGVYKTETSMKNLTAGTEAAKKTYQSLSEMMYRLNAMDASGLDVSKFIGKLSGQEQILGQAMRDFGGSSDADSQNRLKNVAAEVQRVIREIAKLEAQWAKTQSSINDGDGKTRNLGIIDQGGNKYEQMYAKIRDAANGATIANQKFDSTTNTLTYTLTDADGKVTQMTSHLDALTWSVITQEGKVSHLRTAWGDVATGLKGVGKDVLRYAANLFQVMDIVRYMRQGFSEVLAIDTALTELRKVTDETDATYNKFLQTMSKTGAVVGSTVKDLTTSASDWARLNI